MKQIVLDRFSVVSVSDLMSCFFLVDPVSRFLVYVYFALILRFFRRYDSFLPQDSCGSASRSALLFFFSLYFHTIRFFIIIIVVVVVAVSMKRNR